MITVWDYPNPFSLVTPLGSLEINQILGNGDAYLLNKDGCSVDRPLRVTVDNVPQGDGEILHRRFTQGYSITLAIECWRTKDETMEQESLFPACNDDLVRMIDTLMGHVNACLNPPDARLVWTPPGHDNRMFISLRWLTYPTQQQISDAGFGVTVTFDTPFPYSIAQFQTTPALGTPITNAGNTNYYPAIHVDGPATSFVVNNDTLGLGIVYDSTRPGGVALGGGDYAEIDTFKNTIVLNGNVQDIDAGIDPNLSTFWWVAPGVNNTSIVGASGFVLMNDAFA